MLATRLLWPFMLVVAPPLLVAASHRSTAASSDRTVADRGTIDLSLARALAEANRAQFQIRTTENAGTLIEVAFANMRARTG